MQKHEFAACRSKCTNPSPFSSQNCCLLLTPKHLHTVTHACTEHNWGVLHAVGFLWPCAQQRVEAPPPWHLARRQTNITAAVASAGGEDEGGRREAHWDTSLTLYVASKRNCDGEARHTVLITLFLLWRRVFTCTYTDTHGVFWVCVWKRQREYCVYTWIYSFRKTGSQLESTILFFFFLSGVQKHQTHHSSFWSCYTLMISHPV